MNITFFSQIFLNFFQLYGLNIIWILVLFLLGRIALRVIAKKLTALVDDGDDSIDTEQEKRAKTLGNFVLVIGNIVIYTVVVIMFLDLLGVDIRPILAGAGIVGLAIGFGAQSLVKDFVSGLFILIENQYNIGDQVQIDKYEGEVIKITIRSTVLKDKEGKIYYIPNGSIKSVVNCSRKR